MKFSFYTDDVTKLSCGLLGILVFEEQIGEGRFTPKWVVD